MQGGIAGGQCQGRETSRNAQTLGDGIGARRGIVHSLLIYGVVIHITPFSFLIMGAQGTITCTFEYLFK